MFEIVKEEIRSATKKIRFIVLTVLLFACALVVVILAKNTLFNDLVFMVKMQMFMSYIFTPVAGVALLSGLWRKKYTKTSIIQAEEHGVKRGIAVLARAVAGIIILIILYILMYLFILLMGLVFGAHLSIQQIAEFSVLCGTECFSAVATYTVCLLLQYLFALPVIPEAVYLAATFVPRMYLITLGFYSNEIFKYCSFIFPKMSMDAFYTSVLLHNPQWYYPLICLADIVVMLILTMIVFALKKKDRKKKKKGGEELPEAPADEMTEVTTC